MLGVEVSPTVDGDNVCAHKIPIVAPRSMTSFHWVVLQKEGGDIFNVERSCQPQLDTL